MFQILFFYCADFFAYILNSDWMIWWWLGYSRCIVVHVYGQYIAFNFDQSTFYFENENMICASFCYFFYSASLVVDVVGVCLQRQLIFNNKKSIRLWLVTWFASVNLVFHPQWFVWLIRFDVCLVWEAICAHSYNTHNRNLNFFLFFLYYWLCSPTKVFGSMKSLILKFNHTNWHTHSEPIYFA